MRKIKLLFLSIMLSVGATMLAQQAGASISFEELSHDFSTINEADGPAIYEFKFVNTGNEPLLLENVRASCGCTTPSYSKEPVLPGESGFVQVSYNPKNRPGPFNKSITVQSNAANQATVILKINGTVTPTPAAQNQ